MIYKFTITLEDYLFVEWEGDDEYKEDSVIPGKVTEPEDGGYV